MYLLGVDDGEWVLQSVVRLFEAMENLFCDYNVREDNFFGGHQAKTAGGPALSVVERAARVFVFCVCFLSPMSTM